MAPLQHVISPDGLYEMLNEALKELPVIGPHGTKGSTGVPPFQQASTG